MNSSGTRRARSDSFRPDLEGLRAVAVLAVVLYHAGLPGVGGGYVGVDVFYVLSGFLITGLLWTELERTGRLSLSRFYARRARRLLPGAAVVLLVTVLATVRFLTPLRAHGVLGDAAAAALYVANYRFALQRTDYLSGDIAPSPVQHYWSLGVEEQFYLLWPVLLLLGSLAWRRHRPGRLPAALTVGAVVTGSFALSLHLTRVSQPWAFFSLPPGPGSSGWARWRRWLRRCCAGCRPRRASRSAGAGWPSSALRWSGCAPTPRSPAPRRCCRRSARSRWSSPVGCRPRPDRPCCWAVRRSRSSAGRRTRGTSGTGQCWCWHRPSSGTRWGCRPGWP